MRLVSVVTSTRRPRSAQVRHSAIRSSTCEFHRPHDAFGVDQAGRPDHLLDEHAAGARHLPGAGRRRDEHGLRPHRLPLLELERPVVDAGRQPEAELGERRLALKVAAIHAAELRHRDVALVDDQERVVGDVLEQGRRRLARAAAGQVARVVLDAGAGAGGDHHLEIGHGALLDALGLEQAAGGVKLGEPLLQLELDLLRRLGERGLGDHVVAVGVELDLVQRVGALAGQRIELHDALDLVAEHG